MVNRANVSRTESEVLRNSVEVAWKSEPKGQERMDTAEETVYENKAWILKSFFAKIGISYVNCYRIKTQIYKIRDLSKKWVSCE